MCREQGWQEELGTRCHMAALGADRVLGVRRSSLGILTRLCLEEFVYLDLLHG